MCREYYVIDRHSVLNSCIIHSEMSFTVLFSLAIGFNATSTQGSGSSSYSGALTAASGAYTRPGSSGSKFYYQAMPLTVNSTGSYTFMSISNMDTYGSLYENSFAANSSSLNLIAQDDDSAGNSQFRITASLQSARTYILVATTFNELNTGSFSVATSGPGVVRFQ